MAGKGNSRRRSRRRGTGGVFAGRPRSPALFAQAIDAHQSGNLAAAEAAYRAFLDVNPGHPDALHNQGLVIYQQGRPREAVGPLESAAAAKPDDPQVALASGYVLRDLGRFAESAEYFSRVLDLTREPAVRRDAQYALGTVLQEQEDTEGARACYRQVVADEPRHAAAWNSLGTLHYDLGELDEALECFDSALEADPRHIGALCNRGRLRGDLGELEAGLLDLDKALSRRSALPEAHSARGAILRSLGRRDEAVDAYQTALRLRPDHAPDLYRLGSCLSELGRLDAAVRVLRACLEIEPEHVGALVELGGLLVAKTSPAEGREFVEKALAIKPDNPLAMVALGSAIAAEGDEAGAARSFQRAVELEERQPYAWLQLSRMKDFATADDDTIEKLEALCADCEGDERAIAAWHFALGNLRHIRRDYASAFDHYRSANASMRQVLSFNFSEFEAHIAAVREVYTPEFFAQRTGIGSESDQPIFIFGIVPFFSARYD